MQPGFDVRVAHPEDAATVTALLQASYPALMSPAYDPALLARILPMITVAQPSLLASGSYYIAEADGEAIGCGGWTAQRPGTTEIDPGTAHLRHFAVVAARAGQGVGRALYERCEADALRAGVRRLECYSTLNGTAFYAALGFTSLGEIDVPIGDERFPSVHLQRML